MKREEELTVSVKAKTLDFASDCLRNYAALLDGGNVDGAGHYFPADINEAADILSALLHNPKPEAEPVAWTTQAQLDGIKGTGNNAVMWGEPLPYHPDIPLYAHPPEAEHCLWDCADAPMEICPTTGKPCATHPPKPEATEGVDRQVHHSKPVVSQNTQIVEAKAAEGGALEKGWQPIDTAPKDGRHVLLYCDYYGVGRCAWESWRNVWRSDDPNHGIGFPQPTHWMPLPEVPPGSVRALIAENASRAALTAKQTDGREGNG